jgi:3-oxoacyl-[acyl-carrier protein] reductase
MDLGIKGRKALVCASSRGLGKACAMALAREGCSVVINGLDPDRLKRAADNITREEARRRMAESLPAKRLGLPEEFGDACAYLCSAQAGFISGQNLQLDGGAYAGLV